MQIRGGRYRPPFLIGLCVISKMLNISNFLNLSSLFCRTKNQQSLSNQRVANHGFILLALLLLIPFHAAAQRLFSVEEQTKTVSGGKMRAADKALWYTRGGNLVIRWTQSFNTYYTISTPFGFTDLYYPASGESTTLDREMFNAADELLYTFAEGGAEDLGLSKQDFALKSTKKDGSYTVRRYEPRKSGGVCAWVELALDEDALPVCCTYYNKKGKVITKTYFSKYTSVKGFAFPMRVTEISYLLEKNDSTVRLDIYKNLQVDVPDEQFGFHVPSGAKVVDMKAGLKAMKKSAK